MPSSQRHELLEGLVEVNLEAVEELFVVWTTLGQQLLRCSLGALLFEATGDRSRLRDLVLNEGLLGLQVASVLTR